MAQPRISDEAALLASARPRGGFQFDLCRRNEVLAAAAAQSGSRLPRATKTGTTLAGCVFAGGVVLGADTRSTAGTVVADKNCTKIHYLAPNIWCCGAGTAADTENTTALIASKLALLRLNTGTESRVVTAMTMLKRMLFRYQGHIGAALVLGGVDVTGAHLYTIYPHGSTDKLPFVTMGSGSLAAMSVYESNYQDDMTEEQAMEQTKEAILAGVFNDLGSGSNCDLKIIRADGTVTDLRNYVMPNDAAPLRALVPPVAAKTIPVGATPVLSTRVTLADVQVEVMDTS